MLEQLEIRSFKSIRDVTIELGRVNVFIGANGSGKSNLLEALGVLGAAAFGQVDDEALLRRGVRPGVPALYKSSFTGMRARGSIGMKAVSGRASYSVELMNPIRKPEPAWRYKNEALREGGRSLVGRSPASTDYESLDPNRGLTALKAVELDKQGDAAQLLRQLQRYAIYGANTSTLRGLTPDPQQREPLGLAGGRLPEAVHELLRLRSEHPLVQTACSTALSLIEWAASYGSRNTGSDLPLSSSVASARQVVYFRDRYMAEGRNHLTGYDASEGALYVLFATVLAVHPKVPDILAIDNIDHGLNPRLARALMHSICDWVLDSQSARKQLFLTTQNPLVLDGLPLDNPDVRLFAVDRSRRGTTVVNRVRLSPSDLQRDGQLWTVSRLWVMGHLGGVPSV